MGHPPRVFISYSHDSPAHAERVLQLADRLREHGIDAFIDQYGKPPAEGWPRWMEQQFEQADFRVLVITEGYRRRFDGKEEPGKGRGVIWEANLLRNRFYKNATVDPTLLPVAFDADAAQFVPAAMAGLQLYTLTFPLEFNGGGYEQLYRVLTGQPRARKPQLGLLQQLPERVRQPDTQQPSRAQSGSALQAIAWPVADAAYQWPLADRKNEFALFREMAAGASAKRVLLVRGLSNTGKTRLVTELLAYARKVGLPVSLLDMKGCPSLEELFRRLLLDFGKQVLPEANGASAANRPFEVISDLKNSPVPLVLAFDTFQEASADACKWLDMFLERLDGAPAVLVVIAGQKVPDESKCAWRELATLRELSEILSVDDWLEFTSRKYPACDIRRDQIDVLAKATLGNPGQMSTLLNNFAGAR